MDDNVKSYVVQRLDGKNKAHMTFYAVVTQTVQTRISYLFASSPETAAEQWEKGTELYYEYYPDEVQKYSMVTVVSPVGEETVIGTGSNPKETRKRSTPELEL